MEREGKITINDVAKAAGVSKGTVDRVLHDRGEVSEKSKAKVLRVIEELGFKPNLYASLLASRREHKVVCIIPEYNRGEFWELTEKGIEAGRMNVAKYGVSVVTERYDQYDIESFQRACEKTLEEGPVGVVLAPMFRNETLKFVKEFAARGISYVYIDSKLEEDGYLAYFGMPMYQSGYLCADILTLGMPVKSVNIIRIARDKKGLSDPTLTRRTGFVDYISEHLRNPSPETDVTGRVIVQFVVGKDGTVKDAKVVRGIHPEFDAEALRLVENMPKWRPGKLAGETVEVRYTLPVPFKWK